MFSSWAIALGQCRCDSFSLLVTLVLITDSRPGKRADLCASSVSAYKSSTCFIHFHMVFRAEPIMQQNLPTTSSSCTPFATAHPISPPLITATRGTYTCYIDYEGKLHAITWRGESQFPDIVEDFSRAWKPLASIIPQFCSNACVRQEFTSPNTVLILRNVRSRAKGIRFEWV
ncbi:hypothetical protein EJ05DRAFT_270469 [Pseudovirgaria hyperparasitica]|uniref:Uncharacterized protein n=1 Tax=Pseudovirgaria hyperparasitica TaxID=470096 RepID=A0A6A6VTM1_9PEZI|nr:uncharacterized protein EJ05DRAFT_270469 [Pseudovirgaria hyperparasitica]KAF2752621.1 hypothetical protein EJ05DRAFT_270469 [Pseudovirgaria hyperparasitica]